MKRVSWINFALGLWLVAAGASLTHLRGKPAVEDIIAGLFIAAAALWATQAFDEVVSAAASWTVLVAGAWAAIAPFALQYHGQPLALTNDLLVGLTVVVLGTINVTTKFRGVTRHRA